MIDVRKILVPTDFSKYSDKALSEALEIAETFNSEIFLVHVIRGGSGFTIMESFDDATQKKVREKLEQKTSAAFKKQIDKFPLSQKVNIKTEVAKEKIFKSGTAVGADYKHIRVDRFLKLQNLIVGYPFGNFCFYIYFLTEREFVDVLVVSAHGRSGFEDFFFGSTSEKIVRRATCSVLVVKD